MAFKTVLAHAVGLAGVAAFGAALAGMPGVDFLDLEASQLAFICDEPEQPVETPPVHAPVLEPALADATAFPDVLEVFKGQRRACWNGVHDASGQHVVAFLAEPIDLPAQRLEKALRRLGAFALQDPTVFKKFSFGISPSLVPQEPVELPIGGRHDRRFAYPQVDPNNQAAGDERLAIAFQDDVQEKPVPLAPDQLGRTNFPFGISVEVGREFEFDLLPALDRRQGGPTFFEFDHAGPLAVKPDGLEFGLRAAKRFGFEFGVFLGFGVALGLEGFDGGEGFARFGEGGADELGGEFGLGAFCLVVEGVDFHAVGGMIIPSGFGSTIEGLGVLGRSFLEGLGGLGGTGEFESQRYFHACKLGIVSGHSFEKWDFLLRKGFEPIPPKAKAFGFPWLNIHERDTGLGESPATETQRIERRVRTRHADLDARREHC